MVEILALILFAAAYVFISFESRLRTSKSAIALVFGGLLWLLVVLSGRSKEIIASSFQQTGNEILGIIMFLLASMALVEVMSHHHLFDVLKEKLLSLHFSVKKQFLLLSIITFFLSALLDNMTVGLLMIQVAKQFFKGKNLLIAAAGIVIASNAGGSWSPIGDVTTVLLWIAGKYNAVTIVKEGFLPASTFLVICTLFLVRKLKNESESLPTEEIPKVHLTTTDKIVIGTSIISFLLPIFANALGLPPYLGLLFGLGIVWIYLQFEHRKSDDPDVMEMIFKKLDIASINFYAGILLATNALNAIGLLEFLSRFLFGTTQEFYRVVGGAAASGILFATFDNIPLTAITMKLITLSSQSLWVLFALTIGNGGSTFIIGSAAGIAVMGGLKELTVGQFFKIASLATIIAYIAMVAVWLLQYQLLFK